jgi:hypothetical protein
VHTSNQTNGPASHGGSRFLQLILEVYLFAWTRLPEQRLERGAAATTETSGDGPSAADDYPAEDGRHNGVLTLVKACDRNGDGYRLAGDGYWLIGADGDLYTIFHPIRATVGDSGSDWREARIAKQRCKGLRVIAAREERTVGRGRRSPDCDSGIDGHKVCAGVGASRPLCDGRRHPMPWRNHNAARRDAAIRESTEPRDGYVVVLTNS